jgi:hypothetical protein
VKFSLPLEIRKKNAFNLDRCFALPVALGRGIARNKAIQIERGGVRGGSTEAVIYFKVTNSFCSLVIADFANFLPLSSESRLSLEH